MRCALAENDWLSGFRRFLAVVVLGVVAAGHSALADDKGELKEKILAAWQQRYDAVKSVRCEWARKDVQQKWFYFAGEKEMSKEEAKKFKTEYFESSETATFLAAGKLMRLDRIGRQPQGPEGRLHDYDDVMSYDGKLSVHFSPTMGDSGRPGAIILNSTHCIAERLFDTLPVRWAFCSDRISSQLRDGDLAEAKVDHSTANADVKVGPVRRNAQQWLTYWLDSKQGYSIKRMQFLPPPAEYEKGAAFFAVDCGYERHPLEVWVPKRWTISNLTKKGEIFSTTEVSATKLELNPRLTDADFHVDFPPGTSITDSRPGHERKRTH